MAIELLIEQLDALAAPAIPPTVEDLPALEYKNLALALVASHPFTKFKQIQTFNPVLLTPTHSSNKPDSAIVTRSRLLLSALVSMDRNIFNSLDSNLDAAAAQRNFIRQEIFGKRGELEEQASRYWSLIEPVHSRTRTPSAQNSPLTSGGKRIPSVVSRVRRRDNYRCRISGFQANPLASHEHIQPESDDISTHFAPLEVVHGLPYSTSDGAWIMLSNISGVSITNWKADDETNALLLHSSIHQVFTDFRVYFETNGDEEIILRYRTEPPAAHPLPYLDMILSPRRNCQPPLAVDSESLRAVPPTDVVEPDMIFFVIHKVLGDIFWIIAAAQPEVLHQEPEDDPFGALLREENFLYLEGRLAQVAKKQNLESYTSRMVPVL
ncbi:hypothetical protein C8R46DRAFT_1075067 [Mycena filopes]|nr:hypothetical protein C8R46DRAFT_1075067 [Mycena filopes]